MFFMISFNFNKDSFSFSNNVFNSSLLTPYAKIFLSKDTEIQLPIFFT